MHVVICIVCLIHECTNIHKVFLTFFKKKKIIYLTHVADELYGGWMLLFQLGKDVAYGQLTRLWKWLFGTCHKVISDLCKWFLLLWRLSTRCCPLQIKLNSKLAEPTSQAAVNAWELELYCASLTNWNLLVRTILRGGKGLRQCF